MTGAWYDDQVAKGYNLGNLTKKETLCTFPDLSGTPH
jgi:hypothetical protein